jgi:acetylornithine deacetylase/succinyl-diaminopimelate desuccinylase-like protein
MRALASRIADRLPGFLHDLEELLRIPSVSTCEEHRGDVTRCAGWIADHLCRIGIPSARVVETAGHPIVHARHGDREDRPTVLMYAHYDVQPPDPLDEWTAPPFEPVIDDGVIRARGACDDKGQLFAMVKALEILLEEGPLPVNVEVLFEGEEECSSPSLEPFLRDLSRSSRASVALICDTAMPDASTPAVTVSLRGFAGLEISIRGSEHDLHSGVYGGVADNPLHVLSRVVSSLHDDNRRVAIEGFHDGTVAREEAALRPCLDVNGMWGGYLGEGSKTIIPAVAHAKISCRLVAGQDPRDILDKLRRHVAGRVPDGMELRMHETGRVLPVSIDPSGAAFRAATGALYEVFGQEAVLRHEGGSLPVVALLRKHLGVEPILLGFGLETDGAHAPDESFGLDRFGKCVEAVVGFLKTYDPGRSGARRS